MAEKSGPPEGVALLGTTASGKSGLAMSVARRLDGVEILSMDSMSVYRGMDLATAKPSPAERAEVRHHLIDVADPGEEFTVARFQRAARAALADLADRRAQPLLVGGTGLYLRSVIDDLSFPGRWPEVAARLEAEAGTEAGVAGLFARLAKLDPLGAARTTPTNRRRIIRALEVIEGSGRPFSSFGPGLTRYPPSRFTLIGLSFDPEAVDRRIDERFARWMDQGLLDEVRALATRPGGISRTARQALGYRELLAHVEEGQPLSECVAAALSRTRVFARRQWAWFRRDPRIRWVAPGDDPVTVVGRALDGTQRTARLAR